MAKINLFPVQLKPRVCITLNQVGEGTVTCTPTTCLCPNKCISGSQVTIQATETQGWRFQGWSGDYTGPEPQVLLTLNNNMNVTATFVQQTVISQLDPPPASIYNTTDPATGGPWSEGQPDALIADISIRNVGAIPGTLQWRCYSYANQPGETLLAEGLTPSVLPNEAATQDVIVTIPEDPTGTIQFGVMTKGETETDWPTWETGLQLGKAKIWGQGLEIDTTSLLIGGAAVLGLVAVWYFFLRKH